MSEYCDKTITVSSRYLEVIKHQYSDDDFAFDLLVLDIEKLAVMIGDAYGNAYQSDSLVLRSITEIDNAIIRQDGRWYILLGEVAFSNGKGTLEGVGDVTLKVTLPHDFGNDTKVLVTLHFAKTIMFETYLHISSKNESEETNG
jgi:hypothetical protein